MIRRGLSYLLAVSMLMMVGCSLLDPDVEVAPIGESQFVGLEANLMAYYPFSGSAADESGWGNHGTPQGPILVPDRYGTPDSAYWFDGANDVIQVLSQRSLEIVGPITLAAWVRPEATKTQEVLVKGPRVRIDTGIGGSASFMPYGLAFSATGDVVFSLSPNLEATQARSHGYPTNEWFHVAGVYDGDSMMLYVDGELAALEVVTGTLHTDSDPLLIGTRLSLPSSTFLGAIDEVRIYDRALTEGEIRLLAQ